MTTTAAAAGLVHGRLRTLTLGSVGLVSLGAFEAIAVATAMPLLAMGRAVQGLGAGLFSVALYVVVARVVPPALRPRMFAAFAAAWVLPAVVGPPLAGLLVETGGWRSVFLLAAVLALPAALLVEPALRGVGAPTQDGTGTGTGHRRAHRVLWAVGAAAGAAGLHQAGQFGGVPALLLGVVAVAAVVVSGPHLAAGRHCARPPRSACRYWGARAAVGRLLRRGGVPPLAVVGRARPVADGVRPGPDGGGRHVVSGLVVPGPRPRPVPHRAAAHRDRSRRTRCARRPGDGRARRAGGRHGDRLGLGRARDGSGLPVAAGAHAGTLRPVREQGTNSSALQIADALFAAVVLALTGALFAALVDAGTVAYLAGTTVASGLALVAVLIAGRARTATG